METQITGKIVLKESGGKVQASNGRVTLDYDLATGRARLADRETAGYLAGVRAEAIVEGIPQPLTSDTLGVTGRTVSSTPLRNSLGTGLRVTVTHPATGSAALRQHFDLYEGVPFLVLSNEIRATTAGLTVASRRMTPLLLEATSQGASSIAGAGSRTIFVPFDNDMFVRYGVHWLNAPITSSEVTALYNVISGTGIVIGSVTHDQWKTGLAIDGEWPAERLRSLRVFGGLSDEHVTHDSQPHGLVSGTSVLSPRIFVGFYADWRDGMEAYGRANAAVTPPLRWEGGPPFGWNSWAAVGEKVSRDTFVAASDFLAKELTPAGFAGKDRVVYLNFDAFWDFIPEAQFLECIAHARQNGQRVGIYATPFTWWGDDFDRKLEGTEGRYTGRDVLLKASDGKQLPKMDGGYAMDPTHPGTLQRNAWQMDRFIKWGFSYVKLDFLSHGTLEGVHYDTSVTTGIAAYNLGMRAICDRLAPTRNGGKPFFISLSIAPLFPHQYAHSRRVSCDAFAKLDDSEYLLNSVTLGWWLSGTVYAFNDPDHTVLYRHVGHEPTSEAEALTRLNASIIGGTVLLDSDDLSLLEAQKRARRLLTNREVLAIAREGKPFRPVDFDNGYHAAEVFVRPHSDGKRLYVALFNFRNSLADRSVRLSHLGADERTPWRARDLWTGSVTTIPAQGTLTVHLDGARSTILELIPHYRGQTD